MDCSAEVYPTFSAIFTDAAAPEVCVTSLKEVLAQFLPHSSAVSN